jgi:hypothetical protein
MQQTIFKTFFTAILVTLVTGCSTGEIKPVTGPEAAAAYGHITMPVGDISNVMLYKVGESYTPLIKPSPSSHVYPNGDYFFENLEPGKYFLLGFMSGQEAFYFNHQGIDDAKFQKEFTFDIKPGSVNYLGSFEVMGIDRNYQRSVYFDIKRSKIPTKSTILKHLIGETKGTGWDAVFEKALK